MKLVNKNLRIKWVVVIVRFYIMFFAMKNDFYEKKHALIDLTSKTIITTSANLQPSWSAVPF